MRKRLLVSDMDHTLLDDKSLISAENLEAIRRHVASGGLFTVATGRAPAAIRIFPELLPLINLPVITGNGGQVVELREQDKVLYRRSLPKEAEPLMEELLAQFPRMGAVAYYDLDHYCAFRVNRNVESLIENEKRQPLRCTVADSPRPWNKILMTEEHGYMQQVREWLDPRVSQLGRTVFSEETYLEILPLGVSKGDALKVILERYNISPEETVAVGDSPNDLEMLQLAAIGAVVENGAPRLKEQSDAVVCSNREHAVRECLERFF